MQMVSEKVVAEIVACSRVQDLLRRCSDADSDGFVGGVILNGNFEVPVDRHDEHLYNVDVYCVRSDEFRDRLTRYSNLSSPFLIERRLQWLDHGAGVVIGELPPLGNLRELLEYDEQFRKMQPGEALQLFLNIVLAAAAMERHGLGVVELGIEQFWLVKDDGASPLPLRAVGSGFNVSSGGDSVKQLLGICRSLFDGNVPFDCQSCDDASSILQNEWVSSKVAEWGLEQFWQKFVPGHDTSEREEVGNEQIPATTNDDVSVGKGIDNQNDRGPNGERCAWIDARHSSPESTDSEYGSHDNLIGAKRGEKQVLLSGDGVPTSGKQNSRRDQPDNQANSTTGLHSMSSSSDDRDDITNGGNQDDAGKGGKQQMAASGSRSSSDSDDRDGVANGENENGAGEGGKQEVLASGSHSSGYSDDVDGAASHEKQNGGEQRKNIEVSASDIHPSSSYSLDRDDIATVEQQNGPGEREKLEISTSDNYNRSESSDDALTDGNRHAARLDDNENGSDKDRDSNRREGSTSGSDQDHDSAEDANIPIITDRNVGNLSDQSDVEEKPHNPDGEQPPGENNKTKGKGKTNIEESLEALIGKLRVPFIRIFFMILLFLSMSCAQHKKYWLYVLHIIASAVACFMLLLFNAASVFVLMMIFLELSVIRFYYPIGPFAVAMYIVFVYLFVYFKIFPDRDERDHNPSKETLKQAFTGVIAS